MAPMFSTLEVNKLALTGNVERLTEMLNELQTRQASFSKLGPIEMADILDEVHQLRNAVALAREIRESDKA
jgi:hypothetical protein